MQEQEPYGEPDLQGPVVDHGPGAPLIGALVGAAVGAGAWAALAGFTGYEIGYVAWGVGLCVGFGATKLGGRGSQLALMCAGLALVAIFVGKMGAAKLSLGSEVDAIVEQQCTPAAYDALREEAQSLPVDGSDRDVRGFMIDHGYTEASHVDDIADDELAEFREGPMPGIQSWIDAPPSYEVWREDQRAMVASFVETLSLTDLVVENLGVADIVFAGFGVITAYKMVNGAGSPARPPARSAGGIPAARKEDELPAS